MQNLVKNDAKRPDVNSIGIIMKFSLLRSNVLLGPRNGLHNDFLSAKSKIRKFDLRQ